MTARDFAQTLALCERFGIEHTAIGRHRGERLGAKALGLASRSAALVRWARAERARRARFDLALGHGSNDVSVAACAAARAELDDVRLRVGDGAAQRQLPPGARRSSCPTRSRPSAWTATARAASCAPTRG